MDKKSYVSATAILGYADHPAMKQMPAHRLALQASLSEKIFTTGNKQRVSKHNSLKTLKSSKAEAIINLFGKSHE